MKSSIWRVSIVLIISLLYYLSIYEEDPTFGLLEIVSNIRFIGFTFLISIPIVFILNSKRFYDKFGLVFFCVLLSIFLAFLGVGKIKFLIEDSLVNKAVQATEESFHVQLPEEAVFKAFENHLLVDNENGGLSVYDSSGKEVERKTIRAIAKEAVPGLPLTDEQKETTYYDAFIPERLHYNLLEKTNDYNMSLIFRYVTNEVPPNFTPDPDMPEDAKEIKFHYMITYTVALDKDGKLKIDPQQYHKDSKYLLSYKGPGIEAIAGPPAAKLISEL